MRRRSFQIVQTVGVLGGELIVVPFVALFPLAEQVDEFIGGGAGQQRQAISLAYGTPLMYLTTCLRNNTMPVCGP